MIGNVWEWVEDCLKLSYADAPSDGSAREEEPCKARVRRGASWNSTERYLYSVLTRSAGDPEFRWESIGFRIARDYPAQSSAPPTIAPAAPPATSSPGAPQSSDWDGTWVGSWGGQTAAKVIISAGNVLEYDYSGHPVQRLGQTAISGDTLTFGTPRGSVITLTKEAPFIAAAHYRGPSGDTDAVLVRQEAVSSPGAPQSSDWDGTWLGAWGGDIPAKIIISGDNVLEYDSNGNPQRGLGQMIISGNTLTFGTPPQFVITLTKRAPATAAAHYHGPSGELDGELVRQ
jgi:hypothetical protein